MTEAALTAEQAILLATFTEMLQGVTLDGGRKRAAGTKPPWWRDESHEAAIFSHLNKWKHGEREDRDSGAHPLVHLAWRALAIAYQETHGMVDPAERGLAFRVDDLNESDLVERRGGHPNALGGLAVAHDGVELP